MLKTFILGVFLGFCGMFVYDHRAEIKVEVKKRFAKKA